MTEQEWKRLINEARDAPHKPGHVGHNYAYWTVTAVVCEPTDNFAPYRVTMARS